MSQQLKTKMVKTVPSYTGTLRSHSLSLPHCVSECSGIRIFGKRIKSLAFTTDVAIVKNINADAIMAVYPFTPQPVIADAIISVADVPVFVGVGGGVTSGMRSDRLAIQAEHQGAFGVVLNAPIPNDVVRMIKEDVDIPVVVTVVAESTDIQARLDAGADILNVSGAARTPEIVAHIRRQFPEVPIIATGGPTDETILATIRGRGQRHHLYASHLRRPLRPEHGALPGGGGPRRGLTPVPRRRNARSPPGLGREGTVCLSCADRISKTAKNW